MYKKTKKKVEYHWSLNKVLLSISIPLHVGSLPAVIHDPMGIIGLIVYRHVYVPFLNMFIQTTSAAVGSLCDN